MATPDSSGGHYVFLNLQSMDSGGDSEGFTVNRIPLKSENISISTTKNVMAIPLPFSGIITGESSTLALDFGVATKNISISGVLTEQTIIKKFNSLPSNIGVATNSYMDSDDNTITVDMTANEIAQLIHSYVDSSFLQDQQNFTSLIILIDSKVGRDYQYHNNDSTASTFKDNELIPFTYKTRGNEDSDLDARPFQRGEFPAKVTATTSASLGGFVRSFNTTIIPGQPFIEFSLEFEVAFNPLG